MSEYFQPHQAAEGKEVVRRSLLRFAVAAGATMAFGADTPARPKHYPDYLVKRPDREKIYGSSEEYPVLTKRYINHIFRELQQPVTSEKERRQAVEDSLRTIGTTERFHGTALQIDECGIYLTAGHVLRDSEGRYATGIAITDTRDGMTHQTRQVFNHAMADMAVLYAPTGQEPGVVAGLEIDLAPPAEGELLRLVGKWPPANYDFVDSGHVDTGVKGDTWLAVKDLIPYGGTSGSPVIDDEGRLRGVLAGSYGTGQNIEEYVGARVTPVGFLRSLPEDSVAVA